MAVLCESALVVDWVYKKYWLMSKVFLYFNNSKSKCFLYFYFNKNYL
jgi:hypothetical protein